MPLTSSYIDLVKLFFLFWTIDLYSKYIIASMHTENDSVFAWKILHSNTNVQTNIFDSLIEIFEIYYDLIQLDLINLN